MACSTFDVYGPHRRSVWRNLTDAALFVTKLSRSAVQDLYCSSRLPIDGYNDVFVEIIGISTWGLGARWRCGDGMEITQSRIFNKRRP